MMEKSDLSASTILIASSSADKPTWEPVANNLFRKGFNIVTYEADKVALGITPLEISISNERGLGIEYDSQPFYLKAIDAAWFRRSTFISNSMGDGAEQLGLDIERKIIQSAMWEEVPERAWLNSPERIVKADRKISQLRLAQRLGFIIPRTLATNRWDSIQQDLPDNIICKASYSLLYDGNEFKSLFTTPFRNSKLELPIDLNPFPGIWQPQLKKAREWRITVVGDETFDAAIYTTNDAKDDWRKHQGSKSKVEFRKEIFPDTIKAKCWKYLGALGLKFGAFDFIEDDSGKITFLECNPNGQYMWLEESLGFRISESIADELAKIAISNHSG